MINEQLICEQYINQLSSVKIAELNNCKIHQVNYILKKYNIPKRSNKTNYATKLKNNFSSISSELEAYLLGFLLADGQVQFRKQSSKMLRLDVAEKDIEILYLLESYLGLKDKIKIYNRDFPNQNVARISIFSDELCNNLAKFEMVPNKTFILKYPNISNEFHSDFIRGYSDGDGCFTCQTWKLVGTKELLEDVQNILIKELSFNQLPLQKRHKNRLNNNFNLEYGGRKNIAKLYNYFYKDKEFFLKRKKDKAYEIAKKYLHT
jgi:hypothetical protein